MTFDPVRYLNRGTRRQVLVGIGAALTGAGCLGGTDESDPDDVPGSSATVPETEETATPTTAKSTERTPRPTSTERPSQSATPAGDTNIAEHYQDIGRLLVDPQAMPYVGGLQAVFTVPSTNKELASEGVSNIAEAWEKNKPTGPVVDYENLTAQFEIMDTYEVVKGANVSESDLSDYKDGGEKNGFRVYENPSEDSFIAINGDIVIGSSRPNNLDFVLENFTNQPGFDEETRRLIEEESGGNRFNLIPDGSTGKYDQLGFSTYGVRDEIEGNNIYQTLVGFKDGEIKERDLETVPVSKWG